MSFQAAINSQKKKEQEFLLKNERQLILQLKELDEFKSRFFANVSHELRTPLTLILGPLNKVVQSKYLNNKDFTLLKIMQQNGQDLLRLVNEILDLAKLESGKLSLKEEPIIIYLF